MCGQGSIKIRFRSQRMMSHSLTPHMDSDGEDDSFYYGLLNTPTTRADPEVEVVDEYVKYINKDRDEDVRNPLQWWRDHQSTYPNLAQIAFDLFAIPAMSSECERNFSKAS